tara:strand:+ start:1400 stop:1711 length:312 start_codon:yes stop_codon:yes gene_type:complete
MKINKLILIFLFFFVVSCSGIKDATRVLKNEKKTTTDEFLVKKRNPLVLPPNFETIPEPGSRSNTEERNESKLKKILKAPQVENKTINNSSSIEETILNRIRK